LHSVPTRRSSDLPTTVYRYWPQRALSRFRTSKTSAPISNDCPFRSPTSLVSRAFNPPTQGLNARLPKLVGLRNGQSLEIGADVFDVLNLLNARWGQYRYTVVGRSEERRVGTECR